MRLTRLRTTNVGGLRDTDITFDDHRLIAFAGANGTGKSKLLTCLLVPWTRALPTAGDPDKEVEVEVSIEFDKAELDSLEQLDLEAGWNQGRPPAVASISLIVRPIAGLAVASEPDRLVVRECFTNTQFLQRNPSCNLIYLPAERRLLPPRDAALDLSQLAEEVGLQRLVDARNSSQNYGRLDDQEFEAYAKALCVAGSLPSEETTPPDATRAEETRWDEFKGAVDNLLSPKVLRPLTRESPSELFVGLPDGSKHRVHELSSGERQALIIISRVFRAGEGHSLIAIDEPDAYLHPSLSSRLLTALYAGLRSGGRMCVATHSPSILDSLPPDAIFRLSHDQAPAVVESEDQRLSLYRDAGFRASALTQAALLVVVEGDFDAVVLPQLVPELSAAAIRVAGGRSQVLKTVESLSAYDIPIVGVIDSDISAETPPSSIADRIIAWPAADIEGTLLREEATLAELVSGNLVKNEFRDVTKLKSKINDHLVKFKDQAIAEIAQRQLRKRTNIDWPSPRGDESLTKLRALANVLPQLSAPDIEDAISSAEAEWVNHLPSPWEIVRGKWILPALNRDISDFRSGDALVSALLARRPKNDAIDSFAELIRQWSKDSTNKLG